MSLDLSSYMDVFADEAREHLQALNEALLKFEKAPTELEHVNVIFRSAHTLKGMSATMGFTAVAELTHKMENLLTPIRQGELAANSEIIDVLFQCLDVLQELVEAHIRQEEHGLDITELAGKLGALATGQPAIAAPTAAAQPEPAAVGGYPGALTPELKSAITSARNNGREVFWVAADLDDSCELCNVRAFMVLKALRECGEVLATEPAESIAQPVERQAITSPWSPKIDRAWVATVRAVT